MRLWEDALEDANAVRILFPEPHDPDEVRQAIQTDEFCHYAYERKHAALHGMGQYDEAIEAFDSMLTLMEQSGDPEIRRKYPPK